MPGRALKMAVTMAVAALLAGGTAVCLGLIDAGREIDGALEQLEYQVSQLHRGLHTKVERGQPFEADDHLRASVERRVASLADAVAGPLTQHAPPFVRGLARPLGGFLGLVPPTDGIGEAFDSYLSQADQAPAEARRSTGAAELQGRLLDLSFDTVTQRISDAREQARGGISRALTALQIITFVAIGTGALAVGLAP